MIDTRKKFKAGKRARKYYLSDTSVDLLEAAAHAEQTPMSTIIDRLVKDRYGTKEERKPAPGVMVERRPVLPPVTALTDEQRAALRASQGPTATPLPVQGEFKLDI